jgi:hypothetical protein
MTTADKLPKPVYEASIEKLPNIESVAKATAAAEYWKNAYIGKTLTLPHYDDLCLRLAQRLTDVCESEQDFIEADKLLSRLIAEMRIKDDVGTELRIKLADAKDAKLAVGA